MLNVFIYFICIYTWVLYLLVPVNLNYSGFPVPSSINKQRDALFEASQKDYTLFNQLVDSCGFYGYPLSMVIHGSFGSGKTRLLKGIQECANEQGFPCTFFNTSQYNPNQINLIHALISKMGWLYKESLKGKVLRAKVIGTIAGSLDMMLEFIGNNFSLLKVKELIQKEKASESEELFGEWVKCGDPIESLKSEFTKMIFDISEHCQSIRDKEQSWDHDFSMPWIILCDDMDRLLPNDSLDLILSLRSLLGVVDTETTLSPPVIFLFALNLDCLRGAIRSRYQSQISGDADADIFIEQFIRKYFIIGPKLPEPKPDTFFVNTNEWYNTLVSRNFFNVVINSSLSPRTILTIFDRVDLFYLRQPLEHEISESFIIVGFLIELIRFNSEADYEALIKSEKERTSASFDHLSFLNISNKLSKNLCNKIVNNHDFDYVNKASSVWTNCLQHSSTLII